MRHNRFILPLLIAALAACTPIEPAATDSMVVEGWIESGAPPVVMLSYTITPTSEKKTFDSLADQIEKWARVAISDGEKEVVLTGMPSKNHFPGYIYTTGRMFGQAGKTYTITITTDVHTCVASTVIPKPVPLTSVEPVPYGDDNTGWKIKVNWIDDPGEHNVYKAFSRIEKVDSLFASSLLNTLDDSVIASGGKGEMYITPSQNVYREDSHRGRFLSGERVNLKFCTADPALADMLLSLDDSMTGSGLPIFVSNKNIQGNVSGALGYFVGYGRTDYTVDIP